MEHHHKKQNAASKNPFDDDVYDQVLESTSAADDTVPTAPTSVSSKSWRCNSNKTVLVASVTSKNKPSNTVGLTFTESAMRLLAQSENTGGIGGRVPRTIKTPYAQRRQQQACTTGARRRGGMARRHGGGAVRTSSSSCRPPIIDRKAGAVYRVAIAAKIRNSMVRNDGKQTTSASESTTTRRHLQLKGVSATCGRRHDESCRHAPQLVRHYFATLFGPRWTLLKRDASL